MRFTCLDCKEEFPRTSPTGRKPVRCPVCSLARRRAISNLINAEKYRNDPAVREKHAEKARKYRENPVVKERLNKASRDFNFSKKLAAADYPPGDSCEICSVPFFTLRRAPNWDHDHATGKFRGWLCDQCNTGLGNFRDNENRMRSAIDYLERKKREQSEKK